MTDKRKKTPRKKIVRKKAVTGRMLTGKDRLREDVKLDSLRRMSWAKARAANLHIEETIMPRGHVIEAGHQKIILNRKTIMVFADDAPLYNWAHPCRYLLYDVNDGSLYDEVKATFPPNLVQTVETFKIFHQPTSFVQQDTFRIHPELRKDWASRLGDRFRFYPAQGKRYAVLFSGASNNRHTNDLEFLYRTLVDVYEFSPECIYVLNHDGTVNYTGGPKPVATWPGDDTPYRLTVNAAGTKAAFEKVLDELKGRLKKNDFLLIHTNNHGGHNGTESYLCTYSGPSYTASDFAGKIRELPRFAQLMLMMEQSHSSGFNAGIVANSPADETAVASACKEDRSSIGGPEFNPFAKDWISAMTGVTPYGLVLSHDPDSNRDSVVSSSEAFNYAELVKDIYDSPVYNESLAGCGDNMNLGRPEVSFVLEKILRHLRLYEVEPIKRGPWPVPEPGPMHIYDEVIKRIGNIEKLIS